MPINCLKYSIYILLSVVMLHLHLHIGINDDDDINSNFLEKRIIDARGAINMLFSIILLHRFL